MEQNKKAIAYIRVSTEEQSGDGKFGIEAQKLAILNYCNTNNIQVLNIVTEKGSGAKERPLLNEIVFGDLYNNPPYDCVVVYKNDRIARDMQLYFYYEYVLEKRGVKLLCIQDDFLNGVDSSVARLYKSMMQFVAEQERKNITMRTSSGRLVKASKGGYSGGRAPYGYKVSSKKLEINEKEAEIVKLIFEIYDKEKINHSVGKTLRVLKETRPDLLARNGKPFVYDTIRSIVSNRYFYFGLYHYANVGWIKGQHEQILEGKVDFIEQEEKRIDDEIEKEKSGEIYG